MLIVEVQYPDLCFLRRYVVAPFELQHLDLYVLGLIADREIERESYLILRVVSGPQHCALYAADAKWHLAYFLRHCIAFVSAPQEDYVNGDLEFEKNTG